MERERRREREREGERGKRERWWERKGNYICVWYVQTLLSSSFYSHQYIKNIFMVKGRYQLTEKLQVM